MLNLFVHARILQQIGHARVSRFLNAFKADLKAMNLSAPPPLPATHFYFQEVADFLVNTENLPPRLLQAMSAIETAAAPENAARLNALIQAHVPDVSLNRSFPLDCALELWLAAPELLSEGGSSISESSSSSSSSSSSPSASAVQSSAVQSSTVQSSTVPCSTVGFSSTSNHELPATNNEPLTTNQSEIINQNSEFRNLPEPSTFNLQPSTTSGTTNHELPTTNQLPKSKFENLHVEDVSPWPQPVSASQLLDALSADLTRFVILPPYASIALALWVVHTYAFRLRDVTTYIGIESPEKQCGKTTLLAVLNELVSRAVAASNVSPPAFFRVIEDLAPTLLIDEGDTFLKSNDQLRGILNAGYKKKTAFVLRAGPAGPSIIEEASATPEAIGQVTRFSCWCPKVIATIGRLPDTLADRCIVIRMQRKTAKEKCDRLRDLVPLPLKQKCARLVLDHKTEIANALPVLPQELSDRAAEIWEPLLAIADLAGDKWSELARKAAVAITTVAHESNPVATLLLDIFGVFIENKTDRMFSRILVDELNYRFRDRPWMYPLKGKPVTDLWLSHQLRPYGVRSRNMLIEGIQAKGYWLEEFKDSFRRYIPQSEIDALKPFNPPPPNKPM